MTEEQKQALIARCNYLIGGAPEIDVQLAEFALAAFTQPAIPALKLPDGWKLVPVEPTQEMVDACFEGTSTGGIQRGYREMLAASPAAPHTAPIEPICATGGAEWVECSEDMPDQYVTVRIAYWDAERKKWDKDAGQWQGGMKGRDPSFSTPDGFKWPTHWMPLSPVQDPTDG